jgi:hypothetical protein
MKGLWKYRQLQAVLGCAMLLMVPGCGSHQPAIAKGNVKLVEKLHAAVLAKNMEWLEATSKQIDASRQQGKLSDEENAALEAIVAVGRRGNWDEANAELKALIQAQIGR